MFESKYYDKTTHVNNYSRVYNFYKFYRKSPEIQNSCDYKGKVIEILG